MKVINHILGFIGFCILIVTNTGCSFLSKVTVLEARKSNYWSECGPCYSYYAFNLSTKSYQNFGDSVPFTICPCPKPSPNILFGPPFVPLIPNPFVFRPPKPNAKFFVDLKIDKPNQNTSIDLTKIQFIFFKDSIIKPSLIKVITDDHYGEPEELFHVFKHITDSTLSRNIITVTNPLIIRFEFSILTTKVKRLTIRFDSIPEIEFKKHIKFIYKPFVFAS